MQFLTILAILLLISIAAIFAQNPPIRRNNLPQTRPQPRPPPRPMARRPFRPSRPSQFVAVRRPAAAIVVPLKKQKQFSPESVKTINQCLCADIRPCKEKYMSALGPCLDSCQNIVKPLGGDLKQIWQCFKQREGMLKATISCTENKYENACAKSTGFTVPQRYKQNLENMATAEIDKMITKMGLQKEARPFLSTGKKLFECVKNCMNKRSGSCEKSLNCGLALPSDRALVESAKQCAMQGGVNTANAQQLCRCALAAGVKNLNDNLCSRIIIS